MISYDDKNMYINVPLRETINIIVNILISFIVFYLELPNHLSRRIN